MRESGVQAGLRGPDCTQGRGRRGGGSGGSGGGGDGEVGSEGSHGVEMACAKERREGGSKAARWHTDILNIP